MPEPLDLTRDIPQWDYGTLSAGIKTCPPSANSSSGLMLKEHGIMAVVQPEVLQNYLFPISEILTNKVLDYRNSINQLMASNTNNKEELNVIDYQVKDVSQSGKNDKKPDVEIDTCNVYTTSQSEIDISSISMAKHHKLLIITGPTTIDNPQQSTYCAQWISQISGKRKYKTAVPRDAESTKVDIIDENEIYKIFNNNQQFCYNDKGVKIEPTKSILLAMRANATNYDDSLLPTLSTKEVSLGLPLFRTLLHVLAQYCPLTVSLSNTISPQYFSDLCCLGLVESSFLESQLHRELVSGVSYPCGFQTNDFDGYKLLKANEAMFASSFPHCFLSITKNGSVAHVETTGNSDTFAVLSIDKMVDDFVNWLKLYSVEVEARPDNLILESFNGWFMKHYYDLKTNIKNVNGESNRLTIVIDIGLVTAKNYMLIHELVSQVINDDSIYKNLLGFMVDSGNYYLPVGTEVNEINPLNYQSPDAFQFLNLKKKLMSMTGNNRTGSQTSFEHFILANRIIESISEYNEMRRLGLKY